MKIHDVEQGTAAWFALRLGVPTASEFHKILTPGGMRSDQRARYALRLVTEKLLGRTLDTVEGVAWMERGKELEPDAARMYEFEQGVATERIGFVTTDDGRIGCSPDRRIVGANAGIEIKCPAPHTHVSYLIDGFGPAYFSQVQGQLFVTGWDWIDRYSFHPEMPPVRQRTWPDARYQATLATSLREFCTDLDRMELIARSRGTFAVRPIVLSPAEVDFEERSE